MRLNQAGEIIVTLFRSQLSEINNLKSQLADFSGLKRGQISIICSQALLPYFLPTQIDQFQDKLPDIKFNIKRWTDMLFEREAFKKVINYKYDGPGPSGPEEL